MLVSVSSVHMTKMALFIALKPMWTISIGLKARAEL